MVNPDPIEIPLADSDTGSGTSERRTANWDLRNAVRNYSTLVISQIAVAVFSFASVTLIIKYLGVEGNGQIVALIAGSQIIQVFVNWTCIALARYGVEEFVESGMISKSFWARTLILLPNLLLIVVTLPLWFPILATSLKLSGDIAGILVANIAAVAAWLHIQHAFQGVKQPGTQAVLVAVEKVVIFGGLALLLLFGGLTAFSAICAYTAAPAALSVVGLWKLRKMIEWRVRLDSYWFKKIVMFSLPLIPFAVISYLSTGYFDAIFITQFLSKADLGMYSVVYQLNGIMMQFPSLGGILLMPLFVTLQTQLKNENVETYFRDVLPLMTILWGIFCIAIAIVIGFALYLFFGPKFDRAVEYLIVLASGATFAMPVLVGYSPYSNAVSATYISMIAAVAAAVSNVGLNFILIPRYGLLGSAWATAIAFLSSFLVMMLITHIRFKLTHAWTVQATLAVLAAAITVSFTKDVVMAILAAILVTVFLFAVQFKSVIRSVQVSLGFRNTIRNLKS